MFSAIKESFVHSRALEAKAHVKVYTLRGSSFQGLLQQFLRQTMSHGAGCLSAHNFGRPAVPRAPSAHGPDTCHAPV